MSIPVTQAPSSPSRHQMTAGRPFPPHPSTLPFRPHQNASQQTRAPNAPSSGSQTITLTQASTSGQPVLRLRGEDTTESSSQEPSQRGRRIQWAEGTVDNEGLGRKSSKVCCIYHAPRNIDSSSDESSDSSSSDDSDSGREDDGAARMAGGNKRRRHEHGDDCTHGKGKGKARRHSPNAYEKQPSVRKSGGDKA